MATLNNAPLIELKAALSRRPEEWILAAHHANIPPIEGIIGFLDWRLHGIISKLFNKKILHEDTITLIPSKTKLGGASLLLYVFGESSLATTNLMKNMKNLQIQSLYLFEQTFPQDFLPKLKQTLDKAGISWTTFEPKSQA